MLALKGCDDPVAQGRRQPVLEERTSRDDCEGALWSAIAAQYGLPGQQRLAAGGDRERTSLLGGIVFLDRRADEVEDAGGEAATTSPLMEALATKLLALTPGGEGTIGVTFGGLGRLQLRANTPLSAPPPSRRRRHGARVA